MPAQHTVPSECPYCGHRFDAFTGISGAILPEIGDATLCGYCAGLLIFGLGLVPREPDEGELNEMVKDRSLLMAQAALKQVIRDRLRRG